MLPRKQNTSPFLMTVGTTHDLLSEVFAFLDVTSLGRTEQICRDFSLASDRAWSSHASLHNCDKVVLMTDLGPKDQVKVCYETRKYTTSMARVHRDHHLDSRGTYIPLRAHQLSEKCPGCRIYPNLKSSVLLPKNAERFEFFVRMSEVHKRGGLRVTESVVMESFVPAKMISSQSGKHATLHLDLKDRFHHLREGLVIADFLELLARSQIQGEGGHQEQEAPSMLLGWMLGTALDKLELAVVAVDVKTRIPSLLLATGGVVDAGVASSGNWHMQSRLVDSHPGLVALAFQHTPKMHSTLKVAADFSTMEAIELRVAV